MRILLDTNIVLKLAGVGAPPSRDLLRIIEAGERFVSVVTRIEIAVKVGRGKLPLSLDGQPVTDDFFWREQINRLRAEVLSVEAEHIRPLATLPFLGGHKDPWDRLIVSQCLVTGLALVTTDAELRRYGIQVFDDRTAPPPAGG